MTRRRAVAIWSIAAIGCYTSSAIGDECVPRLPISALSVLAAAYPNHRVLQLADLNKEDRALWTSAYHSACPGIVRGAFSAERDEYGVLLIPTRPTSGETKAVLVALNGDGTVTQRSIYVESRVANLPVIRIGKPGVYRSSHTAARIKSRRSVVLLEHLESAVTAIILDGDREWKLLIAE